MLTPKLRMTGAGMMQKLPRRSPYSPEHYHELAVTGAQEKEEEKESQGNAACRVSQSNAVNAAQDAEEEYGACHWHEEANRCNLWRLVQRSSMQTLDCEDYWGEQEGSRSKSKRCGKSWGGLR